MKRKNRLFLLALSVFLPPVCIMLLAATDLVYSQKSIETLARSYVENFTENLARKIERGDEPASAIFGENLPYYTKYEPLEHYDDRFGLNSLIGLGRLPGLSMVLDQNGTVLYGSQRLRDLVERTGTKFPIGTATEIYDLQGERFTICAFPAKEYLIVGAISWRDLPGSTLRTLYLWPLLIGGFGLWSALAIWRLWRRVIIPLGDLESEISALHWGEETLADRDMGAIYELEKVRDTIARVARDAIGRVRVIRSCMNDLVNVQEDERTTISRDIHDGPLQDVTALIQRIHLARRRDNTEEETARELDLAEKIAMATVKEMRALCDFLNPPWLELGLEQALTELTERLTTQYGVRIFLDIEEDLDLTEGVTLAFFRVVQEAVTNSVRHGEAKNIWIDVKGSDDGIELNIQDDGNGFELHEDGTAALRVEGHRGLSNMEDRMALVGGRLKIISYPGEGTCIRGLIP